MDNKLHVFETDTTTSNYENEGAIINFTLGLSGIMYASSAYRLYYGFGKNFVPTYDLMMTYSTESYDPSDLEAIDSALGFYLKSGIKIKLYKFISLNAGFEYSYIQVEVVYSNSDGV